jgi:hypothetical protein
LEKDSIALLHYCTIVGFDRDAGHLVAERIGAQVLFIKANVGKWDELSSAFQNSWEKWARLDVGMDAYHPLLKQLLTMRSAC